MFDIQWLRNHLDAFCILLKSRGTDFNRPLFEQLENQRKKIQVETQQLQSRRNKLSKDIALAVRSGQSVDHLKIDVAAQSARLKECEEELSKILAQIEDLLLNVPNTPHDSVPEGVDENDNVEIRRWGTPPTFDFEIRDHVQIGSQLSGIDFAQANALSGARFVVLHQLVALLHRALAQWMLDTHVRDHGYQEVAVPYIVHERCLYGTGQLPKFSEELFEVHHKENEHFYLIPTAEVPVTNLWRDQIIPIDCLPLKYVCMTPCFRSEAGSYGRDTYGLFRQHQFDKVELVQFVHPDDSERAHEELTAHAEKILQLLELPYRVVSLCRGDLGFSSSKTYDLEVWLPAQNRYREVSSCSNFLSFQARRMNLRYRDVQEKKNNAPHTLNGSALAIGRTLIAILENYQQSDGRVMIPDVLRPYVQRSMPDDSKE